MEGTAVYCKQRAAMELGRGLVLMGALELQAQASRASAADQRQARPLFSSSRAATPPPHQRADYTTPELPQRAIDRPDG